MQYISIGNNCRVTRGVIILAHDYSYAALRPVYHEMLCKVGNTKIGNNVFIGMNSIIMMDVSIGNNVIIGAGSVVTKDVSDNMVVGGNPAEIICTLEAYHEKLSSKFLNYARIFYEKKKSILNREPKEDEMSWYTVLWKSDKRNSILSKLTVEGDDKKSVIGDMEQYQPLFESFDDFKLSLEQLHK